MTPLVSMLFTGATLTEHDDLVPGAALLGSPVWGVTALLANLELRLGLPTPDLTDAVRVQRWSQRLDEVHAASPRFYSASYGVDPLGTATTLLSMRDELVAAGWNGEPIPGARERIDTFVELESAAQLSPGTADRIRLVERELERIPSVPMEELRLAEPRSLWPRRWQGVFARLESLGVRVHEVPVAPPPAGITDLARVQARLLGDSGPTSPFEGDGSLVVLRGETSWEVGRALAAMLRPFGGVRTAIVRGGDLRALDDALVEQGLPSEGVSSGSRWRPVTQVLPLALELAFEPRDPYRVLELLTLPVGPFDGLVGRELARALASAPGIGGPEWREAKETIAERLGDGAKASLARVSEWLEMPGHRNVAPRSALLATIDRVRSWLQGRLAFEREKGEHPARISTLGAAFAQAQALHDALAHEVREGLDLVAARLLVEQITADVRFELSPERASRLDPVDSPSGLRVPRDLVVWWHCVSETSWRPPARPWRRAEVAALGAAGVLLADPAERLAAEARAWRQVVLAARQRLVLVMPRWAAGEPLEPHPIWDEIVARLGATPADVRRVSREAPDLVSGPSAPRAVETVDLGALALPEARPEWAIDGGQLRPALRHSASSLEALVGCPLRWVLTYAAGLREGGIASISDGPVLFGTLGHRLVEELHGAGVLAQGIELERHFDEHLERLLREEAAVLLRPGMTFELAQLRRQYLVAVQQLVALLAASGLTVADVESEIDVSWRRGQLKGRLDLLLSDRKGREVVIDLKWGKSRYRGLLEAGRAIQLSVYVTARRLSTGAPRTPPAGYFTIKAGEMLTLDGEAFAGVQPLAGPSLDETWMKLERTVDFVEQQLAKGRVPVTGVTRSLPLLEALRVPEPDRAKALELETGASCEYCSYSAICGKSWETLA